MPLKIGAVIVCAGKGKRLGADKAAIKLCGAPLFYHTYKLFKGIKEIKQIIIVLRPQNFRLAKTLIKDKRVFLVEGGSRRQDSVFAGLLKLDKSMSHVLIHDGARPFTPRAVIQNVIKNTGKYPAVICAVKPRDTVKEAGGSFVKGTLDRNNIAMIQTPQAFRKDLIIKAYKKLTAEMRLMMRSFLNL
ncbi:MAG: IspD/TarI family cytidylyltransferase [Candidatus Omnitrophica bacterium]|nr:IspD/TarI family cytidylyltransferase [Candidatus Omnitrophota bacterium]